MGTAPGLDMPLEEAMMTQRAVRRLKSDPVDDALLRRLLELAIKAPSGSNAQNWEFVVVRDREVIADFARRNRRVFRIYGGIGRRRVKDDPKRLRLIDAVQWQADHFEEIPVLVFPCLKGQPPAFPNVAVSSYYGSIYPAVQNFLLGCRAVGLGAALITMPLVSTWAARRSLGLPWNVTPCCVIPVGWPIGRYGPTTRRPVEDVVSIDRYGNRAWQR